MYDIQPGQIAHAIERLIPEDAPARPRALAVIDGVLAGRVWADNADRPTWAIVIETADGTVYAGGTITRRDVAEALAGIETKSNELIFGFASATDPLRRCVPADPIYRAEAIDFTQRDPPPDETEPEHDLPPDIRLQRIDRALLPRTTWYVDTLHAYGSVERWERLGVGFAALIGDEIASEALAGPRSRGLLEMGVVTREAHRRRGLGTIVSRRVARQCEANGDRVWWNANADNVPSIAIARRLGFRSERRYELVACRAPLTRA